MILKASFTGKRRCLKTIVAQNSNNKDHTTPNALTNVSHLEKYAGNRRHQSELFIALLDRLPILLIVRRPELHDNVRTYLQQAYTNWGLDLPVARDLPFVTRLTTFDALARNALVLRIPLEYLETDDYRSLFNLQGPEPPGGQPGFPTHLLPTEIQKSTKHHPWVDLFPFPGMRDNILRGIGAGAYDEDQLCNALCCDLLDFDANTKAPLLVWGESWDANGWEFSPEFFRKWGILLKGCPEVLESTNYWRWKRGERLIEL